MTYRKFALAFRPEDRDSKRARRLAGLFRFALAIAVIGVLAALLLDRVGLYQECAEKSGVELTILNLRTGLRFRVVELLIHGQEGEIAGLVGGNPLGLLQPPLQNYAGEFDSAQTSQVPPGRWYFVRDLGELRYRVMRDSNFVHEKDTPAEIRLRVTAASIKRAGTDSALRVEGVSLILLQPYTWF